MKKEKDTKEAFYTYLRDYQNSFYRLAYSYVKNEDAALDVVQEAVASALANYDKLRHKEYMKTWFYRIIVNTALTHLRINSRYISDESILDFTPYESAGIDTEDRLDLMRAIDKLPERLQTIIFLRYFEDLKIGDIAEITNAPESTVKTRLKKATELLFHEI